MQRVCKTIGNFLRENDKNIFIFQSNFQIDK